MPQARKKKLPRLATGQKPAAKTREVELTDLGASVLLTRPAVGAFIALNEKMAEESSEYEHSIALAALCLTDPDLDADQLKATVDEWSPGDWAILQTAALELTGADGGAIQAAMAQFRDAD